MKARGCLATPVRPAIRLNRRTRRGECGWSTHGLHGPDRGEGHRPSANRTVIVHVRLRRLRVLTLTVVLALLLVASGAERAVGEARSANPRCGRILVIRGRTFGSSQILSVRPDGSGVRTLSSGFGAAWSPNGRQLVVQRIVPGGRGLHTALFVTAADGSNARRLTHSARADYWPAWTGDGEHVVFSREQRPNSGYLFYAPADLWEVNVRTGAERRLTAVAGKGGVAFAPSAGPGGSLVLSVIRAPIRHDARKPGADLYVLSHAGRLTELITDPASDSVGPDAFSPDRERLVFFRRGQGIFIFDFDNKRIIRLTRNASDAAPGWSPDGRQITFTRGNQVYLMNADGTDARPISSGTGHGRLGRRLLSTAAGGDQYRIGLGGRCPSQRCPPPYHVAHRRSDWPAQQVEWLDLELGGDTFD